MTLPRPFPSIRWPAVGVAALVLTVACGTASTDAGGTNGGSSGGSSSSGEPIGSVTFAGTIEPLLQKHCQSCHHDGGIAPFPLVTYEDIKGVAEAAKIKVTAREMPPWGAFDDEACKMRMPLKDDLRVGDDDIAKLVSWVDGGMPMGDVAARPAPKTFGPSGLPNKTHTLTMPTPWEVPAGTKDDIRCFALDPGFADDTWVGGVNVLPGDPRAVHHVIVYSDPGRESIGKAQAGGGSYPCFGGPGVSDPNLVLAWAPGVPPTSYGEDVGLKITKGSALVLQVHYHAYDRTTSDQTAFELRVLPAKPAFVATIFLLGNASSARGIIKLLPGPDDPATGPAFVIPANAKRHTETMEMVIPKVLDGITLPSSGVLAVGTHMHLTGVDMKVEIERAEATADQPAKECLMGTPKYDFNWQRGYHYDAAIEKLPLLSGGDKLRFTCTYDNSMDNKNVKKAVSDANMSGPREVHLGETTFDEMCLGALTTVRRASAID